MPSSTGGLAAQLLNNITVPQTTHGGATGYAPGVGVIDPIISRQVFGTAQNPGATGADNVLAVFSLPAGTLDGIGNRGVRLRAIGDLGGNTNVKTLKLIFNPTAAVVGSTVSGGTTVATTGALATATMVTFSIEGLVHKTGAFGSNTQLGIAGVIIAGLAVSPGTAAAAITANESGAILIAVTGNAATAVGDIGLRLFEIKGLN